MEHNHLDELEQLIDRTMAAEDVVLGGLREACRKGWKTQLQIDEEFAEYQALCLGEIPAISPVDLL